MLLVLTRLFVCLFVFGWGVSPPEHWPSGCGLPGWDVPSMLKGSSAWQQGGGPPRMVCLGSSESFDREQVL